jgi:hypothetical protein
MFYKRSGKWTAEYLIGWIAQTRDPILESGTGESR